MRITEDMLTEQQKNCISFPADRNLLVRGVAGSGKSLVIVNRAILLAKKAKEKGKRIKIIIFTYVNTLVDYTKEIIEQGENVSDMIEVSTLDKEIIRLYKYVIGGNTRNLYYSYKNELIDIAKRLHEKYPESRFFEKGMSDFLYDEIIWMKEHMIKNLKEYEENPRKGRGCIRVPKNDRKIIFEAYEQYYDLLNKSGKPNFNVICEKLYDSRNRIPEAEKYDFVLIDEAQDLPLNKILIAREVARKSLTISADFAQKIYKTGFTWKEVGINIRGQASKKLHGTHRNTRQIALLANSLMLHNNEIKQMTEDEYIKPELPTVEGAKPVLVYEPSHIQEKLDVQTLLKTIRKQQKEMTVGVLGRDYSTMQAIKDWLDQAGLEYQEIKKGRLYQVLTPGIKVVTYHSAKGLEFDIVVLPFLDDGIFPYLHDEPEKGKDKDDDTMDDLINNARNLLYVGITRARSMLYMFTCSGGDANPSPLIEEMDSSLMQVKQEENI